MDHWTAFSPSTRSRRMLGARSRYTGRENLSPNEPAEHKSFSLIWRRYTGLSRSLSADRNDRIPGLLEPSSRRRIFKIFALVVFAVSKSKSLICAVMAGASVGSRVAEIVFSGAKVGTPRPGHRVCDSSVNESWNRAYTRSSYICKDVRRFYLNGRV